MSEPLVCPDCKHEVERHGEAAVYGTARCIETTVRWKSLGGVKNHGPCECRNSSEDLHEFFDEREERDDRN